MTPQQQINNFQTLHPNQTRYVKFSREDILELLKDSVDDLVIKLGQDESNKFQLYATSTTISSLNAPAYKGGLPCPTYCS